MAKNKKKFIVGELHFYFATGESSRPQFIGENSLNPVGYIANYEEVYDIRIGDKVRFLHDSLKTEGFFHVNERFYNFLEYLSALWKTNPLKIEYLPNKNTKSWAQYTKQYIKESK